MKKEGIVARETNNRNSLQPQKAWNKNPCSIINHSIQRDFLYISDVIDAYWKILLAGDGQIYNVCRGKSDRMEDILKYLIKRSNKELSVVVKDSYGDNSKLIKDTRWNSHVGVYEALDKISGFNS